MRQLWFASCALLVLCAAARAATYDIKLDRPFHVGQKLDMFASGEEGTREIRVRSDGPDEEEEISVDISLRAKMTVLAVDDRGAITKATFNVQSLEVENLKFANEQTTKKPTKPLAKGTVIIAEWTNGKKKLSLNDGALPPELDRLLQLILPVRGPADLGFDDLIGTDKPRAERDTWPVDVASVSKLLAKGGVSVAAQNLRGFGDEASRPPSAKLQLSANSTRAEASISLVNPLLDSLRGETITAGSGAMTIGSVQSIKDAAAAQVNQYVNWHSSNTYVRGGVYRKRTLTCNLTRRYEPYQEPSTGKPIKKKRR